MVLCDSKALNFIESTPKRFIKGSYIMARLFLFPFTSHNNGLETPQQYCLNHNTRILKHSLHFTGFIPLTCISTKTLRDYFTFRYLTFCQTHSFIPPLSLSLSLSLSSPSPFLSIYHKMLDRTTASSYAMHAMAICGKRQIFQFYDVCCTRQTTRHAACAVRELYEMMLVAASGFMETHLHILQMEEFSKRKIKYESRVPPGQRINPNHRVGEGFFFGRGGGEWRGLKSEFFPL